MPCRIIYSCVMAEQELGLLNDKPLMLSVNELDLPMPDADPLWDSASAEQWGSDFKTVHQFSNSSYAVTSGARPPSLHIAHQHFLASQRDNNINLELSPLQLRLLLQPLQARASKVRADINFLGKQPPPTPDITEIYIKTQADLTECQLQLQRWYSLALRFFAANTNHQDPFVCSTLILYHLIYLNTLLDFPSLERASQAAKRMEEHPHTGAIIFHCSQALAYLQSMHANLQPPWWPAAIYRAALILWTYGDGGRDVVLQQCVDALGKRASLNSYCTVVREKLSCLASENADVGRQEAQMVLPMTNVHA